MSNPFLKATYDMIRRARMAHVALEDIAGNDYVAVAKAFSDDEAEGLLEIVADNLDKPERVKGIVLDIVRIAKGRASV